MEIRREECHTENMEHNDSPRDDAVGRTPESQAELEELRDRMRNTTRPLVTENEAGAPVAPDPRPDGGSSVEMDELPTKAERQRGLEEVRKLRAQLRDQPNKSA